MLSSQSVCNTEVDQPTTFRHFFGLDASWVGRHCKLGFLKAECFLKPGQHDKDQGLFAKEALISANNSFEFKHLKPEHSQSSVLNVLFEVVTNEFGELVWMVAESVLEV